MNGGPRITLSHGGGGRAGLSGGLLEGRRGLTYNPALALGWVAQLVRAVDS